MFCNARNKYAKDAFIVVSVLLVLGLMLVYGCKPANQAVKDESMRRGETRETLRPSMFSDPFVAGMYQVARDIPHVLDSLKCYCYCDRQPFNHISLLSCFVDKHASG